MMNCAIQAPIEIQMIQMFSFDVDCQHINNNNVYVNGALVDVDCKHIHNNMYSFAFVDMDCKHI